MNEFLGKFIENQADLVYLKCSCTEMDNGIGLNLFKNISQNCSKIQMLNIGCCTFSVEMSVHLGKFIGYQTQLVDVDFSYTDFTRRIGVGIFKNILSKCSNIRKLDLYSCDFSEDMSAHLGKFIDYPTHLNELHLDGSIIGGQIGIEIFKNISKKCSNIHNLSIAHCTFSPEMSNFLGKFIGNQSNLKLLDMSDTDICGAIGSGLFTDIHQQCHDIKEMKFANCILSDEMSEPLGIFIEQQTHIRKIDFSYTTMNEKTGVTEL